ncbi:bifunctional DNA primase/polymerase [Rhodoplanes sp. Z2-YC6860]|uniref:bifunctional DNA primase/polymerase n=1 Tax=Rhodoplanes sp. Z2-YC6860 TaxID=674703 RepID=UPI00078EE1BC|nr:bifunctional DNA primase/polymerase [Rhodoplanes sp. Z2-YC6860]AMN44057.1 DNA recombinase RecA [Rhodoplanes sp. Z2-YC6860]
MMSSSLSAALKLIETGLPCFPCKADKSPATPHGFKDAAKSAEAVRQLWLRYSGPLVGIPTGELSGLDVLDVDVRNGGARWFASHRNRLPATRVHRTRSGGLHLLFKHRPGQRCSAGQIAAGIDIRADGGYVIWWPAAGCEVLDDVPPSSWPEWLVLKPEVRLERKHRTVVPSDAALRGLIRAVAQSQPGERNRITFWAACRAGEMVASGLLGADSAVAIIAEAAARAGLPYTEAQRTARSGIRAAGGLHHA